MGRAFEAIFCVAASPAAGAGSGIAMPDRRAFPPPLNAHGPFRGSWFLSVAQRMRFH
jgi:hypothetical protein